MFVPNGISRPKTTRAKAKNLKYISNPFVEGSG